MKNQRAKVFDAVDDDVIRHRKAAQIRAQVVIPLTAGFGISNKQPEAVCDFLDQVIGYFFAAAFGCDVEPDGINLRFSMRQNAITHLAFDRHSGKPRHTTLIDFVRELV